MPKKLTALLSILLFLGMPTSVALAQSQKELLFVTSDFCPFCKAWESQIGVIYDNTPYGQNAPLKRVDIANVAEAFPHLSPKIIGTPTFVILEDNKEIGRMTGYTDKEMFFWQLSEYVPATP